MGLGQAGELVSLPGSAARVGMLLLTSSEPQSRLGLLALLRKVGLLGGDQLPARLSNMLPSTRALTEAEGTFRVAPGLGGQLLLRLLLLLRRDLRPCRDFWPAPRLPQRLGKASGRQLLFGIAPLLAHTF